MQIDLRYAQSCCCCHVGRMNVPGASGRSRRENSFSKSRGVWKKRGKKKELTRQKKNICTHIIKWVGGPREEMAGSLTRVKHTHKKKKTTRSSWLVSNCFLFSLVVSPYIIFVDPISLKKSLLVILLLLFLVQQPKTTPK